MRRNAPELGSSFFITLGNTQKMTPAEIRDEILDILSEIAPDEDLSNIVDEKSFREQLELDSMDFLDIVMELRKRHRIQIPEDEYMNLASMASTVQYLEPKMRDIVKA
ncbi:MAG: acyl carrier protein [Pirellulales bacterium]